jgi:hypothetical protein
MPKKRKRKKGSRYHRGVYTSIKNGGKQYSYRSGWEGKYFEYLENDPDVLSYDYESLKIPYVSNKKSGRTRNYIPDFIVTRPSGVEIIEIKPTRFLKKRVIVKKLEAGKSYATSNNMTFKLLTEIELKAMSLID